MARHATLNGRSAAILHDVDSAARPSGESPTARDGREVLGGRLIALTEDALPLIEFRVCDASHRSRALSTIPLSAADIGRAIVLAFLNGDPERPIILGLIAESAAGDRTLDVMPVASTEAVVQDRIVITAERELVLRCGKATLTLTRAGKILLRGAYVLSRSSGVNRIKGASVQIN